jgi:hypothetical protein
MGYFEVIRTAEDFARHALDDGYSDPRLTFYLFLWRIKGINNANWTLFMLYLVH